jgi:hypothetical protein
MRLACSPGWEISPGLACQMQEPTTCGSAKLGFGGGIIACAEDGTTRYAALPNSTVPMDFSTR